MPNVIFVFSDLSGYRDPDGGAKYLLERRPDSDLVFPGQTVFPGGKMEHGESETQALFREVREELNGVVPLMWQRWESPYLYHVPAIEVGAERDPHDGGSKIAFMVNKLVPTWERHRCFCYVVDQWDGEIPNQVSDEHAPYPLVWLPLDAPEIAGGCDNEIKVMLHRYRCQWKGFTRTDGSWEERNDEIGIVVHGTKDDASERSSARLSAS